MSTENLEIKSTFCFNPLDTDIYTVDEFKDVRFTDTTPWDEFIFSIENLYFNDNVFNDDTLNIGEYVKENNITDIDEIKFSEFLRNYLQELGDNIDLKEINLISYWTDYEAVVYEYKATFNYKISDLLNKYKAIK